MSPPFRADHVGSLLRPPALREAFRKKSANAIDELAYGAAVDDAIRQVVRQQEDIGLQVVTDGEFRRISYWGRFVERMDGLEIREAAFKFRDSAGHEMAFTTPYAVAKVKRTQPLAADEFAFLKSVVKVSAKSTLPSPSSMHIFAAGNYADPNVYDDLESFFADLAVVYREEIAALVKEGCKYIQLDEVALAMLCDANVRTSLTQRGQDPDKLVDVYIDAINNAVSGRPNDVALGIHVCRGNFRGHYLAGGGYEWIAEKFFNRTDATHFLLEFDDERAGDFSPLRFIPKHKSAVLGVISSKTPKLESLDFLRRRIDEAAPYIDLERIGLGPQCGFASTVGGNPVSESDQRAKLSRAVEAAHSIWGSA